ncbi:MAG TPA: ABC transporter permease [Phycisphaerae bacterium]|nr:ABC transporter permease [Phycisphaerae bacterium]
MTIGYVMLQNLRRNPLRTFLTAVAFALPMAVFVGAISMVMAMVKISQAAAQELRLATHHKTTIINMLPEGTRNKIEALDPDKKRLRAVCGMRWFGGKIPDSPTVIQSLGADADTFPIVYSEAELAGAEAEAWKRDRQACVIGYGIAENNHWGVGSRITLKSSVPPYLELEFHVVKIMSAPGRAQVLYFRRDYFSEQLKAANVTNYGDCNIFWVKCNNGDALHSLQDEIDGLFANSPNETKSEDENAFAAGFMQAMGNIPGLMQAMAIVVVVIIALVAGNTMMMSFRERTKEIAVFKAIGFPRRRVFGIVLGESLMLAMVGALIGVIPTAFLLTMFPVRKLGFLPIAALEVSPMAIVVSLIIAMLVGLAAGAWPAYQALRLQTVNALRRAA